MPGHQTGQGQRLQPTLPLPLNGARHGWPSGIMAGALSGALGTARAEAGAVRPPPAVHQGGHDGWHPQHPPQIFGAFSRVLLEAWWALSWPSSILRVQGQKWQHSLLPAVRSHTGSRMLGVQTIPGMIRTSGRWKQGRSSRLVRLQYYLGTGKSAPASQVLVTAQANRLQWDILQSPLPRDSHLTWRKLSGVHSILCCLALEFGPERNTREQQRRECCFAPFVQHLVYKANKSSAWPVWVKKQ